MESWDICDFFSGLHVQKLVKTQKVLQTFGRTRSSSWCNVRDEKNEKIGEFSFCYFSDLSLVESLGGGGAPEEILGSLGKRAGTVFPQGFQERLL